MRRRQYRKHAADFHKKISQPHTRGLLRYDRVKSRALTSLNPGVYGINMRPFVQDVDADAMLVAKPEAGFGLSCSYTA